MGKLGYKGLLLLGGMMMLGGAAQAQFAAYQGIF